ncbi:MAG: ABC transporter permease [Firmicutes bacterium]|nr:ABC transporter permease [Bacillota bacterium]
MRVGSCGEDFRARRLKWPRPKLLLGLLLLGLVVLLALLGPLLSPYSPREQVLARSNLPPNSGHYLGTDALGRDLFTRLLWGARVSLGIALVVVIINIAIGLPYGAISGWYGGWVDIYMMGLVDILYGIPSLLYIIFLLLVLGPGLKGIFITLGLAYWLDLARQVRNQVLSLKEAEFVLAARALGLSPGHIFWRELLPNMAGPLMVTLTFHIPQAIFLEAFLSYLGLGVTAPTASLGVLLAEGVANMRSAPWQLIFPAVLISLIMLGFNLLGEGLGEDESKSPSPGSFYFDHPV